MYNELVKKLCEASPFQPMSREEQEKLPPTPKEWTIIFEPFVVEADNEAEAEQRAIELMLNGDIPNIAYVEKRDE